MIEPAAAALIRQQLVSLGSYVDELREYVSVDLASYRTRPGYRRAAERLVQLIVESSIDTGEKILEAADRPPPPTAREVFQELERLGVLDSEVAALFARRYVGLRNRIVHDYARIDDSHVRDNGQRLLEDAQRLLRSASRWIETQTIPQP